MTVHPFRKNFNNLNKKELKKYLFDFYRLYKNRPVKDNKGGMFFGNMFGLYYFLRKIKPKFVIESGVYKGQTSWLIEKVLPNSKILSIDPDLSNREYISKKIEYSNIDFKNQNFKNIPKNSLVFFDDHQNQIERLMQCKWFGINNVIFDDNYPVGKGDLYTLKHAYWHKGFNHHLTFKSMIKSLLIFISMILKKKIFKDYYFSNDILKSRIRDQKPNKLDFDYVNKNIDKYFEFPPIFELKSKAKKFEKTENPILSENYKKYFNLSNTELDSHSSVTFIKIKKSK